MNYEVTGKLIAKGELNKVSDKFTKREFAIEVENERNADWNDFIKFQLTQDRCDIIENIALGNVVKVSFNLRGRKWEKDGKVSYFNSLDAWRIEDVNGECADNKASETEEIPF